MKKVAYLIIGILLSMQTEAQNSLTDSLHAYAVMINEAAMDKTSTCKNVNEFNTAVQKIVLLDWQQAVQQFMTINSAFLSANKTGSCALKKAITGFDSILRSLSVSPPADSTSVLSALSYVKYKLSGYLNLRIHLSGLKTGSDTAFISLTSADPSIIPPYKLMDSTPVSLFLKPLATYRLTVMAKGYQTQQATIFTIDRDTSMIIQMQGTPVQNTTGSGSVDNDNVKPGTQWLPWLLLGLLLSGLLLKLVIDRRNKRNAPPLPIPGKRNAEEDEIKQPVHEQGSKPYFLSEVMVTAGPRKKPMNEKNADKDLGEDVCGFLMQGDEILVWLLDGTSDFYCLRNPDTKKEYFSSRLLAQSIARKLKTHFVSGRSQALDQMMKDILAEVKTSWIETLNKLPGSEKELLIKNIKSGNLPECAATVLISKLNLNGQLVVYRSGDSKMLVYGGAEEGNVSLDTTLSSKNPESNDRYFFRLNLTDEDALDIQHNTPLYEIVNRQHVKTIIGFSDGIGIETEQTLAKLYPAHRDAVRNEIIYQIQGTEDDKALYIIEILSTPSKRFV